MHAVLFLLVASKEVEKCLLQSCCCKLLKNPSRQSALLSLAPLESSSNVCFPDWMCFHLVVHRKLQVFVCCQKQQLSFDLHKLHTVTRTAEEGEFYNMENMHTHTTTQQQHSTSHHTQKPERKNKKASANFTNCSF